MICSQCGKEIDSPSQFCPYCGIAIPSSAVENAGQTEFFNPVSGEIPNTPAPAQDVAPVKKWSRKKLVLTLTFSGLFIIIAVLAISLYVLLTRDPVSKYISLVSEGNRTDAAALYTAEIDSNADVKERLEQAVHERLDDILKQYTDETISYSEAY